MDFRGTQTLSPLQAGTFFASHNKNMSQLCVLRSYECSPKRASLIRQKSWQLSLRGANMRVTGNRAVLQCNLFSGPASHARLTVDVQTTQTRVIEFHGK